MLYYFSTSCFSLPFSLIVSLKCIIFNLLILCVMRHGVGPSRKIKENENEIENENEDDFPLRPDSFSSNEIFGDIFFNY